MNECECDYCAVPMIRYEADENGLCYDCAQEALALEEATKRAMLEQSNEKFWGPGALTGGTTQDDDEQPSQEDLAYVAQSLGLDPDRLNPNK